MTDHETMNITRIARKQFHEMLKIHWHLNSKGIFKK